MFDTLKMKLFQKNQFIPDIKNAKIKEEFRGLPVLDNSKIDNNFNCDICPTKALSINPLKIDMGRCTLCGKCARETNGAVKFSNFYKLGADSKEKLIVTQEITPEKYYERAIDVKKEIYSIFNRSIKFRQISAGGCNSCEMELNACSNANFDMGRFGIDFVASPRHADGIVITGPITKNMAYALEDLVQFQAEFFKIQMSLIENF